eukprot:2833128-Prymnesium_polylepis.1
MSASTRMRRADCDMWRAMSAMSDAALRWSMAVCRLLELPVRVAAPYGSPGRHADTVRGGCEWRCEERARRQRRPGEAARREGRSAAFGAMRRDGASTERR